MGPHFPVTQVFCRHLSKTGMDVHHSSPDRLQVLTMLPQISQLYSCLQKPPICIHAWCFLYRESSADATSLVMLMTYIHWCSRQLAAVLHDAYLDFSLEELHWQNSCFSWRHKALIYVWDSLELEATRAVIMIAPAMIAPAMMTICVSCFAELGAENGCHRKTWTDCSSSKNISWDLNC